MVARPIIVAIMLTVCFMIVTVIPHGSLVAQTRYATSDNMSGYVHWIDLYDADNNRIDPAAENPRPYSPAKTCGRCHDFDTISHGWHFNSLDPSAHHGRPGAPWIWSDDRTGTHLPLSYRGWSGTTNPDQLGLSRWQVAAKLGGFMPGGGIGSAESLAVETTEESEDRSSITGPLPVDCMMCHHNTGSGYSPFTWTEQIEDENFAYAPTAALGIATVSGNMSRLKDDFDPAAEGAASKMPTVVYEPSRFRSDGKAFIDLVRKPKNDACLYCHTNMSANAPGGQRWLHDDDVHIRAGLACADCHRNSINHNTVRGFQGEQHVAGSIVASLSCQGCHVGSDHNASNLAGPGRFGAPRPAHRGLPPLHFEKLSCTACHSGTLPGEFVERQINSIAHRLGEHIKRTGQEFPGIVGTINLPLAQVATDTDAVVDLVESGLVEHSELKYTPHRMMWPSFWGTMTDGSVTILNPETAYQLVRRPLKVRREFTEELAKVKLSLTERKTLIGQDRARMKPDDWTDDEKSKLEEAEIAARKIQVAERMAAALAAVEKEYPNTTALFVSGGTAFVRKGDADIETVSANDLGDIAEPYTWPVAHNVRPARQSLGATGCLECHSDSSPFFQAKVLPVGVLPDQETVAIKAHELQDADMSRLGNWNQLFAGRSMFKIAGLIALALTGLVTLSATAWNMGNYWRRDS